MPEALAGPAPWVVAGDHPALAGHFPGDPILPGVAILAAVLQAIEDQGRAVGATHWRVAKFHSAARPGQTLTIHLKAGSGEAVAFEVMAGERRVADGLVDIEAPALPAEGQPT